MKLIANEQPWRTSLYLTKDGFEKKYIGTIEHNNQGNTLVVMRTKSKHLHRDSNSLGFNKELIDNPEFIFNDIKVDYKDEKLGKRSLYTTREFVKNMAKVFQFSKKNYEAQYFLPITQFGYDKVRDWKESQQDLFREVS